MKRIREGCNIFAVIISGNLIGLILGRLSTKSLLILETNFKPSESLSRNCTFDSIRRVSESFETIMSGLEAWRRPGNLGPSCL